jgi:hypothetical protein
MENFMVKPFTQHLNSITIDVRLGWDLTNKQHKKSKNEKKKKKDLKTKETKRYLAG